MLSVSPLIMGAKEERTSFLSLFNNTQDFAY